MGTPPPLVEFEPVAVGPLQISHLSAEGGVLALAFLLALALSSHMARRLAVPRALVFDLFAVVAPVVLLASRVPALARSFPGFLNDGHRLAAALVTPGSLAFGAVAAAALAGAFQWAAGRAPLLVAVLPGGALMAGAVAAVRMPGLEAAAACVAAGALAAGLAGLVAVRGHHRWGGGLALACAAVLLVLAWILPDGRG